MSVETVVMCHPLVDVVLQLKAQGPLPSSAVRFPVTNTPPGQDSVLGQEMATGWGVHHTAASSVYETLLSILLHPGSRHLPERLSRDQSLACQQGSSVIPPAAQAVSRDSLLSAGIKGGLTFSGYLGRALSENQGLLIRPSTLCLHLVSPRMIAGSPGSLCRCWGSNSAPHACLISTLLTGSSPQAISDS